MPSYEVVEAEHKIDKPDLGYGPKQIIALALKDHNGDVTAVEWYTNKATGVPNVGMTIEGDITPGKFGGWSFKKAKPQGFGGGGGGGGWKPRDPKDTAAIQRQHSQEMALRYLAIQQSRGKVNDAFTLDGLKAIVDWFELDIQNAPQVYGEPLARKDSERTGTSDVPSDASGFEHPPVKENADVPFAA